MSELTKTEKTANKRQDLARLLGALWHSTPTDVARTGAGAVTGYLANDQYLDQVNPDVSDLGRMRSNLLSGVLSGSLASRGAMRSLARSPKATALGATALGARYGVLMPDNKHAPLGVGLGDYVDPGKSPIPKVVAAIKDPRTQDKVVEYAKAPIKNTAEAVTSRAYDNVMAETPDRIAQRKAIAKDIKDTALPAVYSSVISSLGGTPTEKPKLTDVGMSLAPHLAGGAGGGYLGYRLGDSIGNFLFPDNQKDDYEARRRQENRRWWLQFLGGNLGAVGGVAATVGTMPHINKLIGQYVSTPNTKIAAAPGGRGLMALTRALMGSAGTQTKNLALDTTLAGGLTAAQYASGIVPPGSYNPDGTPGPANKDLLAPLFATNFMLAHGGKPFIKYPGLRKMMTGQGFTPERSWLQKAMMRPDRVYGPAKGPNALTNGLFAATAATAAPSVANMFAATPSLMKVRDRIIDNVDDTVQDLGLTGVDPKTGKPSSVANSAMEGARAALDKKPVTSDVAKVITDVAEDAGVPGVGAHGRQQVKDMFSAAGLATLAQGAGLASGGVAGLVGGDWLADKLLSMAVRNKLLKKRPAVHRFIRDLSSLAGAGLGAYGGMKAVNYGAPAAAEYYNNHLAGNTAPPATAAK